MRCPHSITTCEGSERFALIPRESQPRRITSMKDSNLKVGFGFQAFHLLENSFHDFGNNSLGTATGGVSGPHGVSLSGPRLCTEFHGHQTLDLANENCHRPQRTYDRRFSTARSSV